MKSNRINFKAKYLNKILRIPFDCIKILSSFYNIYQAFKIISRKLNKINVSDKFTDAG